MKRIKQAAVAAGLLVTAGHALAWFGTNSYLGEAHADGGTQARVIQQASSTWDDWVWRGKSDGTVQYCSSNSSGCHFTWGQGKSTSYAHTIGWKVGGGFGFPIQALGVSVSGEFQRQKTWTQTQSENFDMRTELRPGQWAQPVIVAVRRWKKGHFHGAHFRRDPQTKFNYRYLYSWEWRDYGSWEGNEQQWGYKMIHVVNNRNLL
ncbi:hypothetical protein [Variovorax sp. AFSI2.2]|uniref:hypothetical protein n=1 Tax=Variovorax sp. AFSI2.2 TaxID=3384160 RepID=UPI003EBC9C6D